MPLSKRNQKRITGLDSRIFASLAKAQRPLSVKQLAERVNITWPTANKHIQKLIKLNVLIIEKTIRKNRIQINPKFINNLKSYNTLTEKPKLNFFMEFNQNRE